jgi:pimeloyl-ACP methyl ester carboxylesterase
MERFTTSDGIEIAYHRFTPGVETASSDLPPVVLQHGFAADTHANWVGPGVVAALTGAGRSVISVDARGHGASAKPHDPKFYGEERMARDLVELFDTLKLDRLDLVGYSMGAIISLITATIEPRIRRMVVGGIGGGVAEMGGVDARRLNTGALADALRAEDAASITNPMAKLFRRFAESTGADRFALAAQAESVHSSSIALGSITATTLVLVGDADALATRPQVLADAIPGAVLQIVSGDHLGAVATPEFAPAIVKFLAT